MPMTITRREDTFVHQTFSTGDQREQSILMENGRWLLICQMSSTLKGTAKAMKSTPRPRDWNSACKHHNNGFINVNDIHGLLWQFQVPKRSLLFRWPKDPLSVFAEAQFRQIVSLHLRRRPSHRLFQNAHRLLVSHLWTASLWVINYIVFKW